MTKNKTLAVSALLVVLALFNVVVFILPASRSAVFWISYGFGLFSILLMACVAAFAWNKATTIKSKFMGAPFIIVGYGYLSSQMASCILFFRLCIVKIDVAFYIPTIIDSVLLAVCLLSLFGIEAAKDEINRLDKKVSEKVADLIRMLADLEVIRGQAGDFSGEDKTKALKEITKVCDLLRYSDPMCHESLAEYENAIKDSIVLLGRAVDERDIVKVEGLCVRLERQIRDRNNRTKIMKQGNTGLPM